MQTDAGNLQDSMARFANAASEDGAGIQGGSPTTHAVAVARPNDSPILHAAIALAPQIRAMSDEIERGRRLPPAISEAMKKVGIFGMAMPRSWGGPELDPLT